MTIEESVASHYARGSLGDDILGALAASGKDIEHLKASDLAGADELHLGWHAATVELAKDLEFTFGMHILDVGSGIGGPARYFAEQCGLRVTGIDLTEDFVSVANALTRRCGLTDRVSFQQASALALPFASASFDGAVMIHVGMNIEDKPRLFSEVRRVLRPGARFGVYDIMRVDDRELVYPLLWAMSAATSFVEPPQHYREILIDAGFRIEHTLDRSAMALTLGREMRENAARHGTPPLGPHILMGPGIQERLGNVIAAVRQGTIAPIEMITHAT